MDTFALSETENHSLLKIKIKIKMWRHKIWDFKSELVFVRSPSAVVTTINDVQLLFLTVTDEKKHKMKIVKSSIFVSFEIKQVQSPDFFFFNQVTTKLCVSVCHGPSWFPDNLFFFLHKLRHDVRDDERLPSNQHKDGLLAKLGPRRNVGRRYAMYL